MVRIRSRFADTPRNCHALVVLVCVIAQLDPAADTGRVNERQLCDVEHQRRAARLAESG